VSAGADIQGAMAIAQTAPLKVPQPTANVAAAEKAAKNFESVFVSQFLGQMFEGVSTEGEFGGGPGEAMFRSLMLDEYGKQITAQGGFGLSNAVMRQILKHQETKVPSPAETLQ
jgi:peptidoglycan hydrolase FlgJ